MRAALVLLTLALIGCGESTAPRVQPPRCDVVIHATASGNLFIDASAIHDGVLTCRVPS